MAAHRRLASTTAGFDEALGSLGLITGLVSADLMILQVVVLARIPRVEKAWGHDLLTHRHRTLGYCSFWLMLAHVALFALQRGRRAGADWLSAQYELFIHAPWFLFATVGTLILIGVVVTSIRWARKRLRYESWHLLHLYAYLGMGLALPHMLSDGMHFHSALARAYWWAIYTIALAAVLIFRIGLPTWRSWYHRLRVTDVTRETDDVVSVTITGHRLDRLHTQSGQFFIWRFLDGPGWTRGHPYTISDAPRDNTLRVTVQAVGDGTRRIANLPPATRVAIEGPYGTMTASRRRHPKMLAMAAGVGITPIRALIDDTHYAPGDTALIYRYSEQRDAIFHAELTDIAERRGVDLHFLPGHRAADGSWQAAGTHTNDAHALKRLVPDVADRDVFLCGPPPWIASVHRALRRAGVKRNQIHTEDFAW